MSSNTHRHRELLLVLLALCAKRPVRRSDLAAELTRRLGSDYRPSPERVECAIGALEAEGLIESESRDVAQGGQVVVSETVRRLAGSPSAHVLEPLGALALKGLSDPVSATALRPAAAPSTARGSLSNEQQWQGHSKQSAAGMIGVAVA
jgi:hypothetical protein